VSDDGKAWLDQLESTVKQAAETIESLHRKRDDLAARVEELEGQVEALEAAGGTKKGKPKADEAAAWREERKEIRRRVQKLTERLEGLLED